MTNLPLDGLLAPIDDSGPMAKIDAALKEAAKLQNGEIPADHTPVDESQHIQEDTDNNEHEDSFTEMEEPQEEVEVEPEKEKHEKKETRSDKEKLRRVQSEKHRLKAEKAAAEARILELENQLTQSLSAGTYYYGKTAYDELERAKEAQSRALDEGDKVALQKATEDMISAKITIKELEKWANESSKTAQPYNQSVSPQYQQQYHTSNQFQHQTPVDPDLQYRQEMVAEWLDTHPYINPESKKFNPNIHTKVSRFIKDLDRKGTHEPFTPEFFDEVDDYIDSIKSKKPATTLPPVGVVRNSYAGKGGRTPEEVPLTAEEKAHIKSMAILGVTEESYRKYKKEMNNG